MTNFTPDRSLPKYLTEEGKVRGPNGKFMTLDDYLKSQDRMRRYSSAMSRSSSHWREGSRITALWLRFKRIVTGSVKKDDPTKTMDTIKDLVHRKVLTTDAATIVAKIDTMVKQLRSQGQYDLADGLMQSYPVVKAEATLMKLGYTLYLTEDDIIEVFKKARYGVRLFSAGCRVILRKAQRMHPDLVAASAEFRQNIAGQHFGITAGHINIQVRKGIQIVERIVKSDLFSARIVGIRHLVGHLNFVHEQIVSVRLPFDTFPNRLCKFQRVAIPDILGKI